MTWTLKPERGNLTMAGTRRQLAGGSESGINDLRLSEVNVLPLENVNPPKSDDPVKKITDYLAHELADVDRILHETIDSESRLIREVGDYIGLVSGKKLRPIMTLLMAKALRPDVPPPIEIAASLELIHVATLIHDDVIDRSATRRGQPSVNAKWGDDVAILMADYLYSRSFDLALTSLQPEFLRLICQVTQKMCEGEMFQIELREREPTPKDYFHVVDRKTGQLFSACTTLGAVVAGRSVMEIASAREFGRAFGVAFQITDDTLDFIAKDDRWGKDLGADIAGGKQTLPLLLAMAEAAEEDRAQIRRWWGNGRDFASILKTIQRYNGIERSLEHAKNFVDRAIEHLTELQPTDSRAFGYLASLPPYLLKRAF